LVPWVYFHGVELTPEGESKYQAFIEDLFREKPDDFERFSAAQIKRYPQSVLAAQILRRDVEYVIVENDIVIVDQSTGRKKELSTWNRGQHQFVQVKEGISPRSEAKPGASVTHPFYFRLYDKIYAITGTIGSETDEKELDRVYGLRSLRLPSHKPSARNDYWDFITDTSDQKWDLVVSETQRIHRQGRPVLVGVTTIEDSIKLHQMLKEKTGIEAQILNEKQEQSEGEIVQRAGQKGMVTVATNMAGRGTDILLGEGVAELGGLHVIGTERFAARRIDDQLRGRAGRQGQPGSSQFIVSLEDTGFLRYLGPITFNDVGLRDASQRERREKAIHAQKAAEVWHYDQRIKRNRIYSVQDEQMHEFFQKVSVYFNIRRVLEIFPEIAFHFTYLARIQGQKSLFIGVRGLGNHAISPWINHLQFLEDLTEEFEDTIGEQFDAGLSSYSERARENFKKVLSELEIIAREIYLQMSGLNNDTEIAARIRNFESGIERTRDKTRSASETGHSPVTHPSLADRAHHFRAEKEWLVLLANEADQRGAEKKRSGAYLVTIKTLIEGLLQKWMSPQRASLLHDIGIAFWLENLLAQAVKSVLVLSGMDVIQANIVTWSLFSLAHVAEYVIFTSIGSPRAPPLMNVVASGLLSAFHIHSNLDPTHTYSFILHFLTNLSGSRTDTKRLFIPSFPRNRESINKFPQHLPILTSVRATVSYGGGVFFLKFLHRIHQIASFVGRKTSLSLREWERQ
ncbi:MAG: hypothetical protein HYY63_06325, partial [Elusimicrobia bacterium]|nr:hypothetical protein [Elusimicrobiota bacterium]